MTSACRTSSELEVLEYADDHSVLSSGKEFISPMKNNYPAEVNLILTSNLLRLGDAAVSIAKARISPPYRMLAHGNAVS